MISVSYQERREDAVCCMLYNCTVCQRLCKLSADCVCPKLRGETREAFSPRHYGGDNAVSITQKCEVNPVTKAVSVILTS